MSQEITVDQVTVLTPGKYAILDGELHQLRDEQPPSSLTDGERLEQLEHKIEHLERALFLMEMKQPKTDYVIVPYPAPYIPAPINPVSPWYYYSTLPNTTGIPTWTECVGGE